MFNKSFDIHLTFFSTKSPQLLGVDISSSSVKMIELSMVNKAENTLRLESYAIEPMPKEAILDGNINNLEVVGDSIRRAWKRMGTRVKNIALALPAAAVITKIIVVPAGQREDDLAFQVETEANQYIPFALDEVNLDFQVVRAIPDHPDEVEVMIAASRKEKVEDRVAAAFIAGLKATVMDVEHFAAQTAFELIERQLPEGGKDQVIALVDIGASITHLNVLYNGEFVYTRDQPFGGDQLTQEIQNQFNLTSEEAEAAKRNGSLSENFHTEVLQPFCETLALEVTRALQFFFTSTQYTQVNYIFLSGGCAVIPGLEEIVTERTQVITQVVNPFINMELSNRIAPRQLKIDAPLLMIACGLAMRGFDPS
ncbi:pilus assembly protein PilM [Nitrosomonas sp. Nm132]|uniref:pilus assembly protein PilM n=1 Tax=Nitrosomonas sp. Nm132 TaxID=1881053 RepID=UPI0008874291|nr:pilus assembly protein PilM [Nitrosomonas sp. Nm132]SDH09780.1 type IV pilus assembly protein PilM [Nitrosomonas sp. Nm132]